jgi:dipeptidyl aminopeptidase/acylaminoacyl peptidase
MKRDPLDKALHETPIPVPDEAEQRGLEVVEAALAEREDRGRSSLERRWPLPRLVLAFSAVTLLAALLLSPAGAAVRDWVDEVVDTSAPQPEPTLTEIPGGGRLLVQSMVGPWVVQPDGSRRLLGDYEEATWSPRGLFVAAVKDRTLSAVEPDGTPRWSITAAARVADPRWSPSGERIAYRSGRALRIVAGDGTGDRLLAHSTAPIAPAWSPLGDAGLAYVSAAGMLRIVHSESGGDLAIGLAGANVDEIEWAGGGSTILETSQGALRLQAVQPSKLEARPRIGPRRELPLPRGTTVVDAALAPKRPVVAVVLTRWKEHGTRSSVLVFAPKAKKPRRLLNVPGSLGQVAWSPDGRRLLVAWPAVNQWLFLPVGRGEGRAVADISRAFSPGGRAASFPRLEGWCCHR